MMMEAQIIHMTMQPTLFCVLVVERDPVETVLHLKTPNGVEIIKETHPSKETAAEYLEEMKKRYNVDSDLVEIIDNIPYVEEERDERKEDALEADHCNGDQTGIDQSVKHGIEWGT